MRMNYSEMLCVCVYVYVCVCVYVCSDRERGQEGGKDREKKKWVQEKETERQI